MKKFLIAFATVAVAAVMLFCGCTPNDGKDGRDGRDGKDVTITEVYEKYVEEYGEISFADFLKEYLSYTNDDLEGAASLQTTVNKSLLSGVSILSRFAYGSSGSGLFPNLPSSKTSYKVFSGSGVILWLDKEKGDAYIATNCHVVYDDTSSSKFCEDIRLYLYGQDVNGVNYQVDTYYNITGDENYRIKAEIVGASVDYDVALLKVENSEIIKRSGAVAAKFSTERDVYVGETVYAVGNASGEGISASNGIISKDSEQIEVSLSDYDPDEYNAYRVMRTTAAINHGNSGGALYNSKGEIVGLVNAKDDSEDVDNMGYVLPANNARRILKLMYDNYVANGNKMLSGGGVKKVYPNIRTGVSDAYSVYNEQTGRAEIIEKIKVVGVDGSPSSGKLQVGDELVSVKLSSSDGKVLEEQRVTRSYHVSELLFSARVGDTLTLNVIRDGADVDVSITFSSENSIK